MRQRRSLGPLKFVLCHRSALRWAALLLVLAAPSMLAQIVDSSGNVKPLLVYDRDFAADASLVAEPTQTLVFMADARDSIGRFRLAKGQHQFCVSGGAGVFRYLLLEGGRNAPITRRLDAKGCALVRVQGDVVSVRLRPGGERPKPPAWATTTIRVDPPVTNVAIPLVDAKNSPVGGFWAIQDTTINALGSFGNRVLTTTPGSGSNLLVDPTTSFDGLSLFQLPRIDGRQEPAIPFDALSLWELTSNPILSSPIVVDQDECEFFCQNAYGPPPGLQIHDNGNYDFLWDLSAPGTVHQNLQANWGQVPLNRVALPLVPNPQGSLAGDTFHVLFRFYPDGTQLKSLNAGEVALWQGCNFQGPAAVFIPLGGAGVLSPPYPLTNLSSTYVSLDGTAKSVKITPGASLFWGPDASTIQGAAVSDTACLSSAPAGQLFVEPVANTLALAHDLLNNSCVGCELAGQTLAYPAGSPLANFAKWNLTGADFTNAVLTNLNLSGANLSGAKFKGATLTDVDLSNTTLVSSGLDFTGATLTRVHFNGLNVSNFNFTGATLNQVDLGTDQTSGGSNLSFAHATLNQVGLTGLNVAAFPFAGASLCGVSMTGTDNFHLLDLTGANFAGVHLSLSSACPANLSYTNLPPTAKLGSQWSGLNLTGAVFNGQQGKVLSTQANPLDLTGAVLTGVSLQGAVLDYAKGLAGQNLAGAKLNGDSLRFVNLQGAQMYGVQLPNANLEGANMNGVALTKSPDGTLAAANLAGAFLRGVNLSQSKLSGAIFSDANLYGETPVGTGECTPDPQTGFTDGCATAAGATMDETVFNGAYLFGTDFTNATAQGVNFGDAFLVGASFAGARLTASPSGGDSGFSGAFLQGANLNGLTLGNGVSLQNAFVDFTNDGNVIFLNLGGSHTTFTGYWNTPGEAVCAQMTYNGPTTVPVTNQQITCPNGYGYTAGCGVASGSNLNWKSQIDITAQASYLNNSTFTPAPASGNQICDADLKWVPISLRHPPKPPRRPRPRPRQPQRPSNPHDK